MAQNKKKTTAAKKKSNGLNKLWLIGGIVVVLFIAIIVLNNQSNKTKLADSPYDTEDLNQATIDLLNDENYQNIILPADLQAKIDSGEGVLGYFFSPTCVHCKAFTPKLMPIADEVGVEIHQYNLLEYDAGWDDYGVTATPTLVYFKDGVEADRLVGDATEESARAFLESTVVE